MKSQLTVCQSGDSADGGEVCRPGGLQHYYLSRVGFSGGGVGAWGRQGSQHAVK